MAKRSAIIPAIVLLLAFLQVSATSSASPASSAQELPKVMAAVSGTLVYTSTMPVWNVFSPNNYVTTTPQSPDLPLMFYNPFTNALLPALATSVAGFPRNDTMLVYLRKGLYWYNGSATLPFTAWDVYTEFYLGWKVFGWYSPYLTGIRVINATAVEFAFSTWSPTLPDLILSTQISTPYSVWRTLLDQVQSATPAKLTALRPRVESFLQPPWFLGPYYVSVLPPYVIWHLEPSSLLYGWGTVFPYHTWQYYREVVIWWTGGVGETMDDVSPTGINWEVSDLSPAEYQVLQTTGYALELEPAYNSWGILVNPAFYPLNLTGVRLALALAINRTEVVSSWNADGLRVYEPQSIPIGFAPYSAYPRWLDAYVQNFSYDPARASQILLSLGFKRMGGLWYTPQGQQFKLTLLLPSQWTDMDTMGENIASQLTEFGIVTTTRSEDLSTYESVALPAGQFQLAIWYLPLYQARSFSSAWVAGNWWPYDLEYVSGKGWSPNESYPFQWPNGTLSYFNFDDWYSRVVLEEPMSAAYNASFSQLAAFLSYEIPNIPIAAGFYGVVFDQRAYNVSWLSGLPDLTYQTVLYPGINPFFVGQDTVLYWFTLFGIGPQGFPSPLAVAISERSVSPRFAAFLGLPTGLSSHYKPVAISLSLSASATTVRTKGAVRLSARLTYANGTPVARAMVIFMSNGTWIGSATTASNGVAELSWVPETPGNATLTAAMESFPSCVSRSVTITVISQEAATSLYWVPYLIAAVAVGLGIFWAVRRNERPDRKKEDETPQGSVPWESV